MKPLKTFLLGMILMTGHVMAADCKEAEKSLQTYLQALRAHQLPALQKAVAPDAVFKIEVLDVSPSKFFTLSREDFLQQLNATWRFSRDEKLEVSAIRWQATAGSCEAAFTLKENRLLLETPAGQESQLSLQFKPEATGWIIAQVKGRIKTW
ncbi:MAG: hypothetical protein REI12_06460 [Pedobacter sp.]|nr:hypothetical protein [Pedobacter sp.]